LKRQDGASRRYLGHNYIMFAYPFQKTLRTPSAHDQNLQYVFEFKEEIVSSSSVTQIIDRIFNLFLETQKKLLPEHSKLQADILSALSTDRDLYMTKIELSERKPMREAASLYVLNHVMR
jgi:hypothetical protein